MFPHPDGIDFGDFLDAFDNDVQEAILHSKQEYRRWLRDYYRLVPLTDEEISKVVDSLPVDVRMAMVAFGAVLAGGFIRDRLSGKRPSDIDLFVSDRGKAHLIAQLLSMGRGVRPVRRASYTRWRDMEETLREFLSEIRERPYSLERAGETVVVPGELPVEVVTTIPYASPEGTLHGRLGGLYINDLLIGFDLSVSAAAIVWSPREKKYVGYAHKFFHTDLRTRRLRFLRIGLREDMQQGRLSRVLERTLRFVESGWTLPPGDVAFLTKELPRYLAFVAAGQGQWITGPLSDLGLTRDLLTAEQQMMLDQLENLGQQHDDRILQALGIGPKKPKSLQRKLSLEPAPMETVRHTHRNLMQRMDVPIWQLGLPPEGALELRGYTPEMWAIAVRAATVLLHDVVVFLTPLRHWLDWHQERVPEWHEDDDVDEDSRDYAILHDHREEIFDIFHQPVGDLPPVPETHPWVRFSDRLKRLLAEPRWLPGAMPPAETAAYVQLRTSVRNTEPAPLNPAVRWLMDQDESAGMMVRNPAVARTRNHTQNVVEAVRHLAAPFCRHTTTEAFNSEVFVQTWLTMAWHTQMQLAMPVRVPPERLMLWVTPEDESGGPPPRRP